MKIVNQYYNVHNCVNRKKYKQIGLYKLIGKHEHIQSKKFDDNKKPNIEYSEMGKNNQDDVEYECIKKTQIIIEKIINIPNITIPSICENIAQIITNNETNIHEIYCVCVSYSLWEVIEYLLEHYPIEEIHRNNHNFNTLHKTLLALWLWNYHNSPKILPKTLMRNPNDILKTMNILISKNLVESVLEPTPRDIYNERTHKKERIETSLYLLNCVIPPNLIGSVKNDLYACMTTNLSIERIKTELQYILNKSEYLCGDISEYQTMILNKYGNGLKWILTQKQYDLQMIINVTLDLFIRKYCGYEHNKISINFVTILKMLSSSLTLHFDNDFKQYFSNVSYDTISVFKCLRIGIENRESTHMLEIIRDTFNKYGMENEHKP